MALSTADDEFLKQQRKVMLTRLAKNDIPEGTLTKVMETYMAIERAIAERFGR